MIFNGYKSRNIYPQNGLFNFFLEGQLDNLTGISRFGFSGNSSNLEFLLSSGQININSPSNLFLSSYTTGNIFQISGNVDKNTYDIYINNIPYCIGLSKPTGYYNYFYVNSSDVNTNLSLSISGESPDYSYDPFESYYSGQIIPLAIVNSGEYPFKIFSGDVLNNSNFYISGAKNIDVTGTKILNLIANNFSSTEQEIPVLLYTNFGNIVLNFSASGIPIESGAFYLFFGPENNTIVSEVQNNYIVTVKSFTGVNLLTTLEYVSGITGRYYKDVLTTNLFTGDASGIITGSGILNSLQTGTISKYNELIGGYESGTGTGILNKFVTSSGNVSGEYSAEMTGLGSGLLQFEAPITGTGQFQFQGMIGPNGGFLTSTGLSGSGSGFNEFGLYYGFTQSGIGTAFFPYTGSTSITGNFDPSQYEMVNYLSDLFYFTGQIEKFYLISGLAWATGGIVTGQLLGEFGYNFEPGTYTFSKNWTGLASGFSAILDSFNPAEYEFSTTGTTGIIGGTFYTGLSTNGCSFEEPYFIPTGIPSQIYNIDGEPVIPLEIFVLTPTNTGEYTGDNSNNINSRTNISRRGNTPSGSGSFNQIFQQPFYEDGIWVESLSGYQEEYITDSTGIIKKVTANTFMYNDNTISGYFVVSGNNTGYQNFKWRGAVTGNFSDYITIISGISNTGAYKVFYNSYEFSVPLLTGKYAFFISPTDSDNYNLNPSISFYKSVSVSMLDTEVKIPFTLFVDTNETVNLYFDYINGTAINTVDYEGVNTFLSFNDGYAGTEYLTVPLKYWEGFSNGNSQSALPENGRTEFFDIKLSSIEGGYISNKNQIVNQNIRVNIIPPVYNNPVIPTGISGSDQVTLCTNLLGNQLFQSGNGNFSETITLQSPVPTGKILPFRLYFSGINDRLVLRAYSTNQAPFTFFDNSAALLIDTPYIFETGIGLLENTYAVNAQIQGGYSKINSPRQNWMLKMTCDIDTNGSGYDLSSSCYSSDFIYIYTTGCTNSTWNEVKILGLNENIENQHIGFECANPYGDRITGINTGVYIQQGTFQQFVGPYMYSLVINTKLIREDFPDISSYTVNIGSFTSYPPLTVDFGYGIYQGGISGYRAWTGDFACSQPIPFNYLAYISSGNIVNSGRFSLDLLSSDPCDSPYKRYLRISNKGGLLII